MWQHMVRNTRIVLLTTMLIHGLHQEYMATFVAVICYLLRLVGRQIHKKARGSHYELGLTVPQARRYVADVALTIDMHPASLGIEPENDGKVYVADDIKLTLSIAENLFQFAEAVRDHRTADGRVQDAAIDKYCRTMTVRRLETIPSRIMRIKVRKGTTVRAVIVVEHRNVAYAMDWFRNNMHGCIIVMVILPSSLSFSGMLTWPVLDGRIQFRADS